MNNGLAPDQIIASLTIPEHLADKDYLQAFYGHPDWAVRAIFEGHMGWFDGNASNLFPLSRTERAARVVQLAGGAEFVLARAKDACVSGDFQWAAELADHLLALDPGSRVAKLVKADALDGLGLNTITATARNYYLTQAQELRSAAQ